MQNEPFTRPEHRVWGRVTQSLILWVVFCRSVFFRWFFYLMTIVFYILLRFTASDRLPFDMFKLFLLRVTQGKELSKISRIDLYLNALFTHMRVPWLYTIIQKIFLRPANLGHGSRVTVSCMCSLFLSWTIVYKYRILTM